MTKRAKIVKIFYCYDLIDKVFLDDLEKCLKFLKRSGQVDTWGEHEIPSGAIREHEIKQQLKESNIVLLLVSPDFLASDHCLMIQQQAMELREANKSISVIPIILRHATWEQDAIGKLQPLPKDGRPINEWEDRDKAFKHISEEIKKVVDPLLSQPQQQSDVREGFMFIGLHPANGYRWDNDLRPAPSLVKQENTPDAPWLVSQAIGILELSQRYSIFEEKNMLRDFAKLSPTGEAIKQFADSHGYLAGADLIPLYYPDKVGQPDSILWAGESLQFWLEEIEEMSILVTLWEMIQNRQIEALKEHIIWKLDPVGVLFVWKSHSREKGTVITSKQISPEFFYQWHWGEVIRPALHYLCTEINAQLKGHINPTLFPSPKMEMYMAPDSLRSALYILLSMEVREHPIEAE